MRLDTFALTNLVVRCLPLQNWSFVESVKTDLNVIYDSPWCRLRFFIEKNRTGDTLHVFYGRLHALDNAWTMKWNDENCYCWHDYSDTQLTLKFLDGISPQAAYRQRLSPAPITREYHDSEFAKSIINYEERFLKLHAFIWEHYKLRFFELFDLRRPNLWEKYTGFLKEYYGLDEEESRNIYKQRNLVWVTSDPPLYKKC